MVSSARTRHARPPWLTPSASPAVAASSHIASSELSYSILRHGPEPLFFSPPSETLRVCLRVYVATYTSRATPCPTLVCLPLPDRAGRGLCIYVQDVATWISDPYVPQATTLLLTKQDLHTIYSLLLTSLPYRGRRRTSLYTTETSITPSSLDITRPDYHQAQGDCYQTVWRNYREVDILLEASYVLIRGPWHH